MSGRRDNGGKPVSEDPVTFLVEKLEDQATSAREALNAINALDGMQRAHALRRIRRIASCFGLPTIRVLKIVAHYGAKGAIGPARQASGEGGAPISHETNELLTHLDWVARHPYEKNPKTGAERAQQQATAEDLLELIASRGLIDAEAMEYAAAVMVAIHSANKEPAGSRGDAFIRAAGLDGQKNKYLRASQHVAIAKEFGRSEGAAIKEAISHGLVPEDIDPEALRVELQRQRRKVR